MAEVQTHINAYVQGLADAENRAVVAKGEVDQAKLALESHPDYVAPVKEKKVEKDSKQDEKTAKTGVEIPASKRPKTGTPRQVDVHPFVNSSGKSDTPSEDTTPLNPTPTGPTAATENNSPGKATDLKTSEI